MDTVRTRVGSSLTWLRSYSPSRFNSSLLLDSLAVPFTDSQFQSAPDDSSPPHGGVVYLDANGRELSQSEVEQYKRADESPWGFVASRYALTLGIMAIVVNRITHICRPQGRPRPLPRTRRLAIQLPTIAFLAYSGLLLLLITLHSFFPTSAHIVRAASYLQLPQDVETLIKSDMASATEAHAANAALLWRLFLSVCFAVVSSTLLRTLEGNNGSAMNPDDFGNSPTFNLVGFAVLLHLHATSYSLPPNKHVYLSILLQVGEVLGVQLCTCWVSRPPVSRLALTTFFGLTSTIHYLLALVSGDQGYPFVQSFSRAPDVALIAIIILTVFLHALTAAITDTPLSFSRLVDTRSLPASTDDYSLALFKVGTACLSSTRLSGMDSDLVAINTSREAWVEVNGMQVVVKASDGSPAEPVLSDGRGGLDREIRTIKAAHTLDSGNNAMTSQYFASPRWREASKFGRMLARTLQAIGHLALCKILALLPFDVTRFPVPVWVRQLPRRIRLLWHGTQGEERRQARMQESAQRREVQRQRAESDRLFQERAELANRPSSASTAVSLSASGASGLVRRERAMTPGHSTSTMWQRFFSQEFADDDDGEWQDDGNEEEVQTGKGQQAENEYWQSLGSGSLLATRNSDLASGDDDDDDDDDDDHDASGEDDLADVSSELLRLARVDYEGEVGGQASYTNVLMAHLSRQDDGVLTRRGYQRIVNGRSQAEHEAQHLLDVIRQRRAPTSLPGDPSERERMRLCVICYIEDRTIICWPCRCLALCEGCREAMATRSPPRTHRGGQAPVVTHTCPTCRTPVVGYSRLFLP